MPPWLWPEPQELVDRNAQELTAYKQAVDAEAVYAEQVIAGGN